MSSVSRPTGSAGPAPLDDLDGPPPPAEPEATPAASPEGDIDGTASPGDDNPFQLFDPANRGNDDLHLTLIDERLELDEIFLRRLGDLAPGDRSSAAGATRLGEPEIKIEKQVEVTRRPLDLLNEYAPNNNKHKEAAFRPVLNADKALDRAEHQLKAAVDKRDQAQEKLRRNPDSAPLKADLARQQAAVDKAEVAVTGAKAAVADAETGLRTFLKNVSSRPDAEIDALDLGPTRQQQTTFVVKVGDEKVRLIDNNSSPATSNQRGLATEGNSEPVGPLLERSNLGTSAKKILNATSDSEGNFTALNGYDKKGVSLGFIQFAGGRPGDLLPDVLERFKSKDPAGFQDALGQHGITVEGKPAQLVAKDQDGKVLKGKEAADYIGSDPRLAAALSASGNRPAAKTAQIEAAAQLLIDQRKHRLPGTEAKVSDVITSEYGNALLYDRTVNAGGPGTKQHLDGIVKDYLQHHKGADITVDPARSAIEKTFIAWAAGESSKRAAHVSGQTDHAPGSYHD
jgi:hypothetical protein